MSAKKIWAGRFTAQTDPLMEQFGNSLDIDQQLFDADIAVNKAWAESLAEIGVYSQEEADQVVSTLDQIQTDFHQGRIHLPEMVEDIHSANEKWLTERLGQLGEKIHTGRSRNDQVVTDLRLYLREQNQLLQNAILAIQQALIARAEEHLDTVFPGHTHLQHAQPISLAHYLMALFFQLERDRERLKEARERVDKMPLGSGALAGAAFPIDRTKLAARLHFGAPSENSYDATSDRDFVLELNYICAQIMIHLSRVAEDWIIWCSEAYRFAAIAEPYTTGSSMMPQKRNPDSLELIRGKTSRTIGNLVAGMTLLKAVPTAYVRDLQEDKPPLFDTLKQTLTSMMLFERIVLTTTFDAAMMEKSIEPSLYATDVADYLVRKGLPFRQAHDIVGRLVQIAEGSGQTLVELPFQVFKRESELFAQDIGDLFDPMLSINKRDAIGGTAISSIKKQIELARELLKQ